jgi:hypothetical protein
MSLLYEPDEGEITATGDPHTAKPGFHPNMRKAAGVGDPGLCGVPML